MQVFSRLIIVLSMIMCSAHISAQRLSLFSPDQRVAAGHSNAIVMDFLERYFNELPQVKHTTVPTKMADDKVYFRKGKLSDLNQVCDTMPFSISLHDRYYEVKWMKVEDPFVTIVFPAQYDLLLGMHQEEAQRKLKNTILASPQRKESLDVPSNMVMQEDSIFVSKTDYLELRSFNDATYYNKERSSFKPFFHESHPDYSAANLFHGLIDGIDYRMYVEQSVYGLKSVNYTISLRQWLDYCAEWGMEVFFAVEEQREDGLLALVVARSKEFCFNHMLSVVIPSKFMTDTNTVLKVRMTPYIPTHNVKNLFQKEAVKRRKINWQ